MTDTKLTLEEQYEYISNQHGGYWRHDFIDHNYLYNLYFPPETFFSHARDHIKQLVLNYPMGAKGSCVFDRNIDKSTTRESSSW